VARGGTPGIDCMFSKQRLVRRIHLKHLIHFIHLIRMIRIRRAGRKKLLAADGAQVADEFLDRLLAARLFFDEVEHALDDHGKHFRAFPKAVVTPDFERAKLRS
jgi:hypothetical protein